MKRIELDTHEATLMAGLLANHLNEQFVKPRVLHVDISKEMQLRYVEARTHAYAKYLLLYQDLGGRHGFPNRPGKVEFKPPQAVEEVREVRIDPVTATSNLGG